MNLLKQGKTNWKYILIIAFLSIIASISVFYFLKQEDSNIPLSPVIKKSEEKMAIQIEPEQYLKLISPNANEEWQGGKTYHIQWEQRNLENWGNQATICFLAFDNEKNPILSKEIAPDTLCSLYISKDSYLIANTSLTDSEYQWTISEDIDNWFSEQPKLFKVYVLVVDNLPSEERTEWAGQIAGDESDDYFRIK